MSYCEGSGYPFFLARGYLFNRSTTQMMAWKLNLQREENRRTRKKTFGVRLRSTNLSSRAELGSRSRVVEVRDASDDSYTNLSPPDSYLDQRLVWEKHCESLCKRISTAWGGIRQVCRYVPQETLMIIYNPLIKPLFDYFAIQYGVI